MTNYNMKHEEFIKHLRQAHIEGYNKALEDVLRIIPTSWLDPIMSDYLSNTMNSKGFEEIMLKIHNRIKKLKKKEESEK